MTKSFWYQVLVVVSSLLHVVQVKEMSKSFWYLVLVVFDSATVVCCAGGDDRLTAVFTLSCCGQSDCCLCVLCCVVQVKMTNSFWYLVLVVFDYVTVVCCAGEGDDKVSLVSGLSCQHS